MKKEIRIALLALVTICLAIWGYKFISGQNLFSGDKMFYTIVDNAKDINSATPVMLNGYQVGTINSISPLPENVKQIKIGFHVKKEIRLPNNTLVEIRTAGALGGKEFELIFDKMCETNNCVAENSVLDSKMVGLLGSIITEDELKPHIETVTASISNTLGALGKEDSDAAVDKTIRNLSTTMENMASSTTKLAQLMNRSSKNIEVTMANMATLTDALVSSNDKLSTILNDMTKLTGDLSKVSISESVNKTNKTIDQATVSLAAVEKTMNEASSMVKELNSIVAKMGKGDNALGMLLNDKELYTNIESSTSNLNLLLQDIRLNPRRYFKVFGRKVPDYEYPEDDPAKGKK